jgi:hypothetical protein
MEITTRRRVNASGLAMRTMLVLLLAVGSVGSAVALDPLRFQWDSPVGIVTRLYHDYAFSAVLDFNAPYGPVENEPRRVLEKYFDATLTEDLLRDQRCAVQSGGVCNLDFQPMWNSQDQIGTTVENIEDLPKAGDVAVILNYNQTSQKGQITYHVVKTKQGWRIHDIETEHWSLRKILRGRLEKD